MTESLTDEPNLQVGFQLQGSSVIVYYKILIYGTHPVRYHLESSDDISARALRSFWNKVLGALNLVSERSGSKAGRYHLFYEIDFPEKTLKQWGEK